MPQIDPLSAQSLAQQNTYGSALADRLRQLFGANGQGALGGGMAAQAGNALASAGYLRHVQEAQAMGQQPMSPDAWTQMQQMQQMPQRRGLLDY